MRVNIGITTYNGAGRADNLLKSISMRTPMIKSGDVEIVLVDDGSPRRAETAAVAKRWAGELPVTYLEHRGNRGISAGWNTATRSSGADITVLVNDDVIVATGGWLESLVHVLERSPGVGVVGQSWHAFMPQDVPALLSGPDSDLNVVPRDPVTKNQEAERRPKFEDTNPGRVMCPTGQLFAFRRSDFDVIGGFDETFKSFYEESSFGVSMAQRGLIGAQINWPFCFHLWSATFQASPELRASDRMAVSKTHFRNKWGVPEGVHEFDYTNKKFFSVIGDVPIEFLRKGGPAKGVLRRDGAFIAEGA